MINKTYTFYMSKFWMSMPLYDLYEYIQIYIRFEKMNPEN